MTDTEIERIEALMRDWKDLCAIDGNSPGISWHPPLDTAPPILHKLHRWRGIASGLANAFHALLEERKELLRSREWHMTASQRRKEQVAELRAQLAEAQAEKDGALADQRRRLCALHDEEVAGLKAKLQRSRNGTEQLLAEAQAALEASASSQERAVAEALAAATRCALDSGTDEGRAIAAAIRALAPKAGAGEG